MPSFQFATVGRILFGAGRVDELPGEVAALGRRCFVVTGASPGRWAHIFAGLGVETEIFSLVAEPTLEDASAAADAARAFGADVVLGFGGGSAIDLAKAVSALATNRGEVLDYLEVIGAGQPLRESCLPCIAVPTTSGTGAEVTSNAVLQAQSHRVKVSLRSGSMLPDLALVDPELSHGLPADVTAWTGMDALIQVIEPFLSHLATPLTDAITREAIPRGVAAIRAAAADDPTARAEMAFVSLAGGLALSNAKLGAVHGIAGPLGGLVKVPHGLACARLLAGSLAVNLAAARDAGDTRVLGRLDELAEMIGVPADSLAGWARGLCDTLQLPELSAFGVDAAVQAAVIAPAMASSSMKGNPIALNEAQIAAIFTG